MINLSEVGAHVDVAGNLRFCGFLPGITAGKGYSLEVRIIHELDQFTPEIPPKSFSLKFDPAHPLGLWSATVDIPASGLSPGSFGKPGRYFYRYRLRRQRPGEAQPT